MEEQKPTPFTFLNSITENKKYQENLEGYVPNVVNKGLSLFPDTVLYANEMNEHHELPERWQYDYYFYGIRKGKRRSKWPKKLEDNGDIQLLMDLYQINKERATEALELLNEEQLTKIRNIRKG